MARVAGDDAFEPLWQGGVELGDPRRHVLEDRRDEGDERVAVERPRAGDHLVEHDAEGEDVRAVVDGAPLGLLGRHVGGGAEDHALHGQCASVVSRLTSGPGAGLLAQLGETEVEDLDVLVVGDHDVAGLEVAVDQATLVGRPERLGDLHPDAECVRRPPCPPAG